MKKKHSSGSLDPTKLVVGIGILAVIAVAAGLLSAGAGSFQGSMARTTGGPGLYLAHISRGPRAVADTFSVPTANKQAMERWKIRAIGGPYLITGIGFDVDADNTNEVIGWDFSDLSLVDQNGQSIATSSPNPNVYIDPTDGTCTTIPLVNPIQLTDGEIEIGIAAQLQMNPDRLRSQFRPILCIEGPGYTASRRANTVNTLVRAQPQRIVFSPNTPPGFIRQDRCTPIWAFTATNDGLAVPPRVNTLVQLSDNGGRGSFYNDPLCREQIISQKTVTPNDASINFYYHNRVHLGDVTITATSSAPLQLQGSRSVTIVR